MDIHKTCTSQKKKNNEKKISVNAQRPLIVYKDYYIDISYPSTHYNRNVYYTPRINMVLVQT